MLRFTQNDTRRGYYGDSSNTNGTSASITDLKRNPMGVMRESENGVIAILNRNQPAFYCLTPEMFAYMQELIEDVELVRIAEERKAEDCFIEVYINDL